MPYKDPQKRKEFHKAYNQKYREENKERLAIAAKKHQTENADKIKQYQAAWYQDNKEKIVAHYALIKDKLNKRRRERYELDPEKGRLTTRVWRKANPGKVKESCRKWGRENVERKKEIDKAYHETHKDKINIRQINRRMNIPKIRLKEAISSNIRSAIKSNKNGHHWENLVGYTLRELMNHLEKQFKPGMSWKNYGKDGWHIDHKIPVSIFNFTKPTDIDFKKCWALTNLQPMWDVENKIKGDKLSAHFQPSFAFG